MISKGAKKINKAIREMKKENYKIVIPWLNSLNQVVGMKRISEKKIEYKIFANLW